MDPFAFLKRLFYRIAHGNRQSVPHIDLVDNQDQIHIRLFVVVFPDLLIQLIADAFC